MRRRRCSPPARLLARNIGLQLFISRPSCTPCSFSSRSRPIVATPFVSAHHSSAVALYALRLSQPPPAGEAPSQPSPPHRALHIERPTSSPSRPAAPSACHSTNRRRNVGWSSCQEQGEQAAARTVPPRHGCRASRAGTCTPGGPAAHPHLLQPQNLRTAVPGLELHQTQPSCACRTSETHSAPLQRTPVSQSEHRA